HDVTDARLVAEEFLFDLARVSAPSAPEHWDDILLVVTELAANAVQYAPGPFELRLRRTFDGVHVVMHDTSATEPAPRPFHPSHEIGRAACREKVSPSMYDMSIIIKNNTQ